jgi:hypothetical protein
MKWLRRAALIALALVAGGYGWWQFATRYAPEGQPPLATIDPASVAAVKQDFNKYAGETRIILLLSPT